LSQGPAGGVPALRVRALNDAPVERDGRYVLYWMIAARRTSWSFALDRAVERARALARPLVVLEALRAGYPWASERLHAFVLQGMADNQRRLAATRALYHPYVEPTDGAGRGLLEALAARACLVVTDEFPCFFLPRMVAAAARRCPVRMESVDGNGLLPLRAVPRALPSAAVFRRHMQKVVGGHLEMPRVRPFAGARLPEAEALPPAITRRWPAAPAALLAATPAALGALPIDHGVGAVALRGGSAAAGTRWRAFLERGLRGYADDRNQPERDGTSRLSPYLHFGHVGAHRLFAEVMEQQEWTPRMLPPAATGAREGFWRVDAAAQAFLDQLLVWRELGHNMCFHRAGDYDRYESLPDWARRTLAAHERDRREHLYSVAQLEGARTHDPLWNAAMNQMKEEGWFHNYMRMLWGKKILEWSRTPEEALGAMIQLMNRWSLDGRDPNSYTGSFWTLGRYDRPWAPERPIFGRIRYMSSQNTARKLRVKAYVARYGGTP
jgi:deoxyribodipyrimidine photo-lyase